MHCLSTLKLVVFSVRNGTCDELIQEIHFLMLSPLEETLFT